VQDALHATRVSEAYEGRASTAEGYALCEKKKLDRGCNTRGVESDPLQRSTQKHCHSYTIRVNVCV
jgi:hypothetical protein